MTAGALTMADLRPLMRPDVHLPNSALARMTGRTEAEITFLLGHRRLTRPALPSPRPPPVMSPELACFKVPRAPWRDTVEAVASRHSVTAQDLLGPSRKRRFARPRQEAYAAVLDAHGYSLPRIGKIFGGRDHTTVLYGIRQHLKRQAAADE